MTYLDNNATTKVDDRVLEAMLPFLKEDYGNPSSVYRLGKRAAQAVGRARRQVAELLGCEPSEVLFTSCGTESDNSAIAAALFVDRDRKHLVTSAVEHSAIMKHADALARRGYEVTFLEVDGDGQIDLRALERAIRPDTALVSLMWANNETGVLFSIEEIADLCRAKGTPFHTDAVQAVGKIPLKLSELPIQFLSLSGHKLHAPKGVGALYVNRRARFDAFLIGGSQENRRRGGTENTASIVALGAAAALAQEHLPDENTRVRALRDRLEEGLLAAIPGTVVNGDRTRRLPNTTNLSMEGIDSETVLLVLDQRGICCSAGSACTAGSLEPSHVLKAMGFSNDRARGSLRFSLGRYNTAEEIEEALRIMPREIEKVRALSNGVLAA